MSQNSGDFPSQLMHKHCQLPHGFAYLSAFVCFDIFFKFRALFLKKKMFVDKSWCLLVLAQCGSG